MKLPSFLYRLNTPLLSAAFVLSIPFTLVACGGGSASDSQLTPPVTVSPPVTPPVVVVPPVVVAPPDQVNPPVVPPPVTVETPVVIVPPIDTTPPVIVPVDPPIVVKPPIDTTPPVIVPVDPPIVVKPPINQPGGSPLNPVAAVIGDDNVTPIYVDASPFNKRFVPNSIFADVKVCAPDNPGNCAVIDHVLVDTGSTGLRIFADQIPAQLLTALPVATSGGEPLAECVSFISGITWGSLRKANIGMGGINQAGKLAINTSIQIISDPAAQVADVPATCQSQGVIVKTAADMSAKGILGIGQFAQDCGTACAVFSPSVYYSCAQSPCRQISVPLADQVSNPVIDFGADNNGNIIVLPKLPNHVANRADGMLIFGLGTRANNALPTGSAVLASTVLGYFASDFNGRQLAKSLIDSGSTVVFAPSTGTVNLSSCEGSIASFFCPGSYLSLPVKNMGLKGTASTISLHIIDALAIFSANPQPYAIEGLAGLAPAPYNSLVLGASFFYGRSVGTLIEGRSAIGLNVTGPAVTHTP